MTNIFKQLLSKTKKSGTYDLRVQQSLEWYQGCIKKNTPAAKNVGGSTEINTIAEKNNNPTRPTPATAQQIAQKVDKDSKKPDTQTSNEEPELPKSPLPGWLFSYGYDARWKKELPYWDAFPLTLVLAVGADRFLGLNFHYISPIDRAALFDQLHKYIQTNPKTGQITINITYSMLASQGALKYHKPCIKEYLFNNIKGTFAAISPKEWDIAMFLPTESFQKQPKEYVWKESRRLWDKA